MKQINLNWCQRIKVVQSKMRWVCFPTRIVSVGQNIRPLAVSHVAAVVVVVGSNWLLLSIMQRSAPPLLFPCFDEVGTSVVCRPLNLQGRACVTAAATALVCYTANHCCAQPTKCCEAQPTTGNFTAFSAAAFISLTKNCCHHEVDAAWESEQSRFTISIGVVISRDPLADRVLNEAGMVSIALEVSVATSSIYSCLSTFPAHVLTRS